MSRIFVSVPAYRDPECYWTIKDLFEKAKYPQLISVGLCLQIDQSDDDLIKNPIQSRHGQVRVLKYNWSESKGVCWARHKVQTLWQGEEYYFQIDSHMRFEQNWDETLHRLLRLCDSNKPVISTIPAMYTLPNTYEKNIFSTMHVERINDDGLVTYASQSWGLFEAPVKPIKRYVIAGAFIFASSKLIQEVPYDPHLYWGGEEITLAVRAWTNGWDIFAPNDCILYHYYGERPRHWIDNTKWYERHDLALLRVNHLLNMKKTTNDAALVEMEKYGLGKVRTLKEYQEESGINFEQKMITKPGTLTF